MNHTFNANINNLCSICARTEMDHSDIAQCEACANVGPCEVINNMLLCASCYDHDKQLQELDAPLSNDKDTRVAQLTNRLAKEIPIDRRMYFVGRLTAIVDVEQELLSAGLSEEDTRYKLAQLVEANLLTLKERLTVKHNEIRELQGASVADQKYLNQIVPQLRLEEREKFKAYDISYKPSAVAVTATASKPRMSASNKAMESMAKMLGISVEQARASLSNATKNVLNVTCTCQETPGLCKLHPK